MFHLTHFVCLLGLAFMALAVEHFTSKTPVGSCNIVGGEVPPESTRVGPLSAPAPVTNPTHDPEGAKIVLNADDVTIKGATDIHADLNHDGGADQLGAMGAPGVELPDDEKAATSPEAPLPHDFVDPDDDEPGVLAGGGYFPDDPEGDDAPPPPKPGPVTRKKSGAKS